MLPPDTLDFSGGFNSIDSNPRGKLFLFLGFLMSFGSLFGAGWILFHDHVVNPPNPPPGIPNPSFMIWPGVAVFLQNILISSR